MVEFWNSIFEAFSRRLTTQLRRCQRLENLIINVISYYLPLERTRFLNTQEVTTECGNARPQTCGAGWEAALTPPCRQLRTCPVKATPRVGGALRITIWIAALCFSFWNPPIHSHLDKFFGMLCLSALGLWEARESWGERERVEKKKVFDERQFSTDAF